MGFVVFHSKVSSKVVQVASWGHHSSWEFGTLPVIAFPSPSRLLKHPYWRCVWWNTCAWPSMVCAQEESSQSLSIFFFSCWRGGSLLSSCIPCIYTFLLWWRVLRVCWCLWLIQGVEAWVKHATYLALSPPVGLSHQHFVESHVEIIQSLTWSVFYVGQGYQPP